MSKPSEFYTVSKRDFVVTWLDSYVFSLELLKLSLILLAEMGLCAVLPDTLRRNELARVKCVAPSLQIMAPWPSMASSQHRRRG